MDARSELKAHLLAESKEDHTGLWYVLTNVERDLHPEGPAQARRITLDLVRELLESGQLRAGFPTLDGRGFVPWTLSPAEALARIEREWDALGREPTIGDIVWFDAAETKYAPS